MQMRVSVCVCVFVGKELKSAHWTVCECALIALTKFTVALETLVVSTHNTWLRVSLC